MISSIINLYVVGNLTQFFITSNHNHSACFAIFLLFFVVSDAACDFITLQIKQFQELALLWILLYYFSGDSINVFLLQRSSSSLFLIRYFIQFDLCFYKLNAPKAVVFSDMLKVQRLRTLFPFVTCIKVTKKPIPAFSVK